MSYTSVLAVWPGERHECLEELRNSHGSAPVIWDGMCGRYLGGVGWWSQMANLWPLYKRDDIPKSLRAVLMMTFDRAYVEKKDYAQAALDIEEFLRVLPPPAEYVNHWPRIAEIFRSDPDAPAIGFQITSVGEDLFCGEWNEELEEYDQPDWGQFWSVYDDEALKQQPNPPATPDPQAQ